MTVSQLESGVRSLTSQLALDERLKTAVGHFGGVERHREVFSSGHLAELFVYLCVDLFAMSFRLKHDKRKDHRFIFFVLHNFGKLIP